MISRRKMLGTGAALMATACAPQKAQQAAAPCWRAEKPLPFPVQEIYPAAHKGRIHVAGGLVSDGRRVNGVSDRHIAWDPKTGETATLAPLPWKRHHPQLVSTGGKLYLLGGFATDPDRVTWICSSDTLVYDDAASRWSPLASAPEPHAECVSAAIASRIHIVGGRKPKGAANAAYGDQDDTTRHLVFDPAANTWTIAAPALSARNSAAGAMLGGLWHVAGGRSMAGGPSDAHEVYDPKADTWRIAAPMPKGTGAGGNAAVMLAGSLYVFGGEFFEGNAGGVHNAVWRYEPRTDAWSKVSETPTPRHGLGAVVIGDAAYLVGGATQPSGNYTSDKVERFSLTC